MVLRRVPQGALRQADRQHLHDAGGRHRTRQASRSACATPASCEQGVSDEKMDNPVVAPHLADVAAQQVRGLHGPRDAPARPRDGRAHRSDDRLGRVAHADLRDRLGEVDVDGVVEAAASKRGFSFNRERYDNLYQHGICAERGTAAWYRNVAQERQQHAAAVERVERAAGQLPGPLQRAWRRCRT